MKIEPANSANQAKSYLAQPFLSKKLNRIAWHRFKARKFLCFKSGCGRRRLRHTRYEMGSSPPLFRTKLPESHWQAIYEPFFASPWIRKRVKCSTASRTRNCRGVHNLSDILLIAPHGITSAGAPCAQEKRRESTTPG